jgi:hypothetical protein
MSVNYVSTPEVNFPPVLGASEDGVLELVIYLLMPVLQNKTNFNGLYIILVDGRLGENGAGEGNRTLVFSLEGCCSTIELHPRRAYISNIGAALNGKKHARGFGQLSFGP